MLIIHQHSEDKKREKLQQDKYANVSSATVEYRGATFQCGYHSITMTTATALAMQSSGTVSTTWYDVANEPHELTYTEFMELHSLFLESIQVESKKIWNIKKASGISPRQRPGS